MKTSVMVLVVAVSAALLAGCTEQMANSRPGDDAAASETAGPVGLDDLLARARAENKLVLLDFTGSDWCPPCMQLKKNVLSTREFNDYARKHLVFAEIDFPRSKKQSPEVQKANRALGEQFKVEGLPTLVLLDANGKELWQQSGYSGETASEFISTLERFAEK